MTTSVGVRELRQAASELLRRVSQGETFEITDRGRPVAILGPVPEGGPLETLRSTGQVDPATAGFADLPEPLTPVAGAEPASSVLSRLRHDER